MKLNPSTWSNLDQLTLSLQARISDVPGGHVRIIHNISHSRVNHRELYGYAEIRHLAETLHGTWRAEWLIASHPLSGGIIEASTREAIGIPVFGINLIDLKGGVWFTVEDLGGQGPFGRPEDAVDAAVAELALRQKLREI